MPNFKYSSLIDAPVEAVWKFHEREDILKLLTPPGQPIQVIRRSGGLEVGATSEFRLFLGPIPLRWVARHVECDRFCFFTDKQIEGPMQSWLHRHQFDRENGQTRLTDAIEYALIGGWLVDLLLGWWVDIQLQEMFRYRHQVTKRECEQKQ